MENEHLVSKDNYIQSSIKVHRQHMKEQGGVDQTTAGHQSFAAQSEGVFGGLNRVYEGFIHTGSDMKRVPNQAKHFLSEQQEALKKANLKGGSQMRPELDGQH